MILDKKDKLVKIGNQTKLNSKYFGEGSDIIENSKGEEFIIMLTWRERKILKFNLNYELIQELDLPKQIRQGWGITHDPKNPTIAYITDGSWFIFVCDFEQDFKVVNTLEVKLNGKNIKFLNELEWINGYIWANIFLENFVVKIHPVTANVEKVFEFDRLVKEVIDEKPIVLKSSIKYNDVLNGIAFNPENNLVYITGKNWPYIYEIEFDKNDII